MTNKSYSRVTNYYETDKMGIIHHSNYIRYFEEARIDWMNQMGLSYEGIENLGLLIPVMFANCCYLFPLRFGDEIEVQVKLVKFDGIKMEFSYIIVRKDTEEICTTGRTGHCFLNTEMKPVRMKREFPELHRLLIEAVEKE